MRAALVLLSVFAVAGACTSAPDDGDLRSDGTLGGSLPTLAPPPEVWPAAEWDRDEAGRWEELDRAAAATGSTCVAVVKDGTLVHRWTAPGATARTAGPVYSVTKSVTALLVGIAVDDGLLSLDDRVAEHVPQWQDGPSADVTVEQLLSMTSGRRWSYDVDYGQMIRREPDKTAFSLGVGQEYPPGEHWEYDNMAVQVLAAVLSSVTEGDVEGFARERLLDPVGLRDTTWDRDPSGATTTYSGIRSSCDDLARIGLLVARGGLWDGGRILSADLVQRLTGTPSSDLNAAYGGLWWVNAEGRVQTIERAAGFGADRPPTTGRLAPEVPADARWAIGYGNQILAVVPSRDVVAVRIGARPSSPDDLGAADLTARALAGLA
ncbi:serine hydrolase [Aeromicrobium sp. 50.2.37]|uniref:serine hydrolase domain-containing protein n=1 Tax=Aeromicrobium sp. 50.2.37 TaxID=2969305 RepID=UPI00214FACFA|nr:serine hydrolase domain-containing protein [Aeromicrobium sp. 50.2.37]MCR4511797.1 beta-lactamase family protein [Aeromicrobium sp. 50.2.37]